VSRRQAIRARLRAVRWWAAVAGALLLGFADLARGGVVLAPILLAVAYLVLVPTALLRR
jgi:hypothetical protein